jgi:hypothetical protein
MKEGESMQYLVKPVSHLNVANECIINNSLNKLKLLHQNIRHLNRVFPNPSKILGMKLYKEWMDGKVVNRLVIFCP